MAIQYIDGTETINSSYDYKTQVFKATHVMEGGAWKRSSLMHRSFISFSYGGKIIEDFNLIATIADQRMQRNIYGNFEDDTTSYEVLDGQYYWGTHFINNGITFNLSTDGITESQLNEFKYWFSPGKIRELILAENPNRAILARVSGTPVYSFIPFEQKIDTKVDGIVYNTSTTLYKGDITLSLIADTPFWYSKYAFIAPYYTDSENKFDSMTQDSTDAMETLGDKDFLKVMVEDRIPFLTMMQTDALLADNMFAAVVDHQNQTSSVIGEEFDALAARIEAPYIGIVGVKLGTRSNDNTISLNAVDGDIKYLYYAGTAPSQPTIEFTFMAPIINDYIAYPLNMYYKNNGVAYNTFTIGDEVMRFTLPSLFLGYNQAIAVVSNFQTNSYVEDIRQALIVGVHEYYSRAWAIYCLDDMINNNLAINSSTQTITNGFTAQFIAKMKLLVSDDNNICRSAHFKFNSQIGMSEGTFDIKDATADNNPIVTIQQNTGDMLRSQFITINTLNYPNENNYITDAQCTPISTDYPAQYGGLTNVLVTYKNMYY